MNQEMSHVLMHVRVLSCFSRVRLCDAMDCSLPGSSVHGISQTGYWSGLPFPPPGDLPNPGIKPTSSALARGFFTTSTTWEVPLVLIISAKGNNQTKLFLDTGLPPWHWILAGWQKIPSCCPLTQGTDESAEQAAEAACTDSLLPICSTHYQAVILSGQARSYV